MGKSLVSCFFDSRCALHLHAQTLREDRTRSCGDVLADRQTDRQTHRQTDALITILCPRFLSRSSRAPGPLG